MRATWGIVLCIAFVPCAFSKPPAPSTGKGDQHPIQITDQSRHEAADEKKGTDERPLVVRTIAGPRTQEATDQEKREREEKSPSEWWMVGSTIWIAFVTTFLAIYTARLWKATKKLAEDSVTTGNKQLAIAEQSAGAAKDAANAAAASAAAANTSANSVQSIERAWIMLSKLADH